MTKKALFTVTAVFIAVVLLLAMGEIYARLACRRPYLSGLVRAHPVFHHLPPPYYRDTVKSDEDFEAAFATNNAGMRGERDYSYEKPEGVFRIAVMGDSFVFGVGVGDDATACRVLEKLLQKKSGRRYEVYNFGVYSYSPLLEYIYLKRELVKYDPDLVVLMLDISDIQDDYEYEKHIITDAAGGITACDPMKTGGRPDVKAVLMRCSRLFYILDQKLFQSFRKIRTIGFAGYFSNKLRGARNKLEILENKDIDNISFDKLMLVREGKRKDIVMRHWARTANYLGMIKDYLDGRGIKFILVIYPYGHQVGPNQWAKGRRYWGLEQGRVYDSEKCFVPVEEFARARKIDLVNICAALKSRSNEELYFTNDGHWTKKGNEVVAQAIFDSDIFRRNVI